jgi:MFS family permease
MSSTSVILSLCQFLYMAVTAINLAFNSLVARQLAPDPSLATVPYLFLMGTTAALVLFLPKFFDTYGYRKLFLAGAAAGGLGGLLASLALYLRNFPLFCGAGIFVGLFQASAMYYRYAAADSVDGERKSTAIAWVLNGGILSALLSKYIANSSLNLLPIDYLGSYVVLSGLALASVPILILVPLAERQRTAGRRATPLRTLLASMNAATFQGVVLCSMSYFVMALVMLASPLAMTGCGFHASHSASVIQWHLLGMFAPSLVTGRLIARFGSTFVAFVGLVLLALSCVLALRDQTLFGFHLALTLTGVGWNLMYLAGSTLLTLIEGPEVRSRAQSVTEFLTFAVTTLIAGATGWLYAAVDWVGVLTFGLGSLLVIAIVVTTTHVRTAR